MHILAHKWLPGHVDHMLILSSDPPSVPQPSWILPSQDCRDSSSVITFGDASPEHPPCVFKALPHEGDPENGLDSYVVLTTEPCCCRCPTAEGAESTRPRLACTDCTVFVTLHSLCPNCQSERWWRHLLNTIKSMETRTAAVHSKLSHVLIYLRFFKRF